MSIIVTLIIKIDLFNDAAGNSNDIMSSDEMTDDSERM